MKKRLFLTVILAAGILAALHMTAFAGETDLIRMGEIRDSLTDESVELMDTETVAWADTSDSYYDQLTGDAKGIYEAMLSQFQADADGTESIPLEPINFSDGERDCWILKDLATRPSAAGEDINAGFETWSSEIGQQLSLAVVAFLMDQPQYFWVRHHFSPVTGYSNGYYYADVYFVAQAGVETTAARDAIREQFDETVEYLVEATEGLAPAQRVAWWDNWLAVNNAYNGAAASDQNYALTDATPWLAMSSLLEGYQPVCEGYAKGLQVLCHEAGIPCLQLEGNANGGGHMWNAIKLDGAWYFCDTTWNDPNADEDSWEYSTRTYLLSAPASTHATSYYPALGTPTLSYQAYGQPIAANSGWQATGSENRVGGYELGSKIMLLAVYDTEGRLLDLGVCQSVQWNSSSWIYVSPAFDEETLEQAGRIVRINLSDLDGWKPWSTLKTIL